MGLTVKVGVDAVLQIGAGPEVNELEVEGLEVDQEVLILDVPVDDSLPVASNDSLHHLAEKVPCHLLLKHALLSDEVKEVLAWGGLLHHVDEGVLALVEVQQLDDSGHRLNVGEKLQLQGNSLSIELEKNNFS